MEVGSSTLGAPQGQYFTVHQNINNTSTYTVTCLFREEFRKNDAVTDVDYVIRNVYKGDSGDFSYRIYAGYGNEPTAVTSTLVCAVADSKNISNTYSGTGKDISYGNKVLAADRTFTFSKDVHHYTRLEEEGWRHQVGVTLNYTGDSIKFVSARAYFYDADGDLIDQSFASGYAIPEDGCYMSFNIPEKVSGDPFDYKTYRIEVTDCSSGYYKRDVRQYVTLSVGNISGENIDLHAKSTCDSSVYCMVRIDCMQGSDIKATQFAYMYIELGDNTRRWYIPSVDSTLYTGITATIVYALADE